jgi:hypothetical protein
MDAQTGEYEMSSIDAGSQPPRAMRDCPRYNVCSVPICPLDNDWELRTHIDGEPVCIWLTEARKPNAVANFEAAEVSDLLPWCNAISPAMMKRLGPIRRALERAGTTGSRLEQFAAAGLRLAEARAGQLEADAE